MSANSRTTSSDPMAASPSVSGHAAVCSMNMDANGLSMKWCRGSDERVTGIPSGWSAARRCTALCHCANSEVPCPEAP